MSPIILITNIDIVSILEKAILTHLYCNYINNVIYSTVHPARHIYVCYCCVDERFSRSIGAFTLYRIIWRGIITCLTLSHVRNL